MQPNETRKAANWRKISFSRRGTAHRFPAVWEETLRPVLQGDSISLGVLSRLIHPVRKPDPRTMTLSMWISSSHMSSLLSIGYFRLQLGHRVAKLQWKVWQKIRMRAERKARR